MPKTTLHKKVHDSTYRKSADGKTITFHHRPIKKEVQSAAIAYFKSCPWDVWWQEFCTQREKSGSLTYTTAWEFAKAKGMRGKDRTHADIIYLAIGPKPLNYTNHYRHKVDKVHYLGDWAQLRAKAYFYDRESLDSMRVVLAEKMSAIDAGRGAATAILDLLAKWMKYDDKIDEAFNYSPVVNGVSDSKNDARSKRFFSMKRETMQAIMELTSKFLECHGITAGGLNDLGSLLMAAGTAAANAALKGTVVGQGLHEASPALTALSQAVMDKARIFNLPLPSSIVEEGKK